MLTNSPASQKREASDPSTSAEGLFTTTKFNPCRTAALSARVKKTIVRVTAVIARKGGGNCQKVEKEGKRLAKKGRTNKARVKAESEVQKMKRRRDAAKKECIEQKACEKQEEREAREERKRQDEQKQEKKAEDKKRKRPWKGVAWGFDDRAGANSLESSEKPEGRHNSDSALPHDPQVDAENSIEVEEIERTRKIWHKGNSWGIEAGGPGPEVVFEFGIPINPKSPKNTRSWRREARKKASRKKLGDK